MLVLDLGLLNNSYAQTGPGHEAISYVGKVTVSKMPQTKGQQHMFTMPFLPQSQSAFNEAKSKPKSIHLNDTLNGRAPEAFAAAVSGMKMVNVVSSFYGLDQTQCNCSPPDVQIGVGPAHIVEMVNTSEEIWLKQGTPLTTVSLYTFFSIPQSDFISDPRVFYDSSSSRWFASILDVSTDSVKIAVSVSEDPTKAWNIYNVSFGANCPDQPAIAVNDDKLVVSANDFANCLTFPTLVGAQYFVIDKSQLVEGSQNPSMQSFGPDMAAFSIMPATSLGPTPVLYMVSAYGSTNTLKLYSINGSVPNATPHSVNLSINKINIPPGAVQNGTSSLLQTNDDRIVGAVWSNGRLWLSLTDSCTPAGDLKARSCIRIVELDTATSKVVKDFDIGTAGFYYFYPALTLDGAGNLYVLFGYSSATAYPGLMLATQTPTTNPDSLASMQVIQAGAAPDTSGRYGDYFDVSRDPANMSDVFVAGEFHQTSSGSSPWDTYVGETSYIGAPEFQSAVPVFVLAIILPVLFRILGTKKGITLWRRQG
ncbi:MAG: hypothetical protein KGI33_07610 [Thaumarchaeota archaeon]|nr:hypothetical protein [Nitrososphaerota archaeon]